MNSILQFSSFETRFLQHPLKIGARLRHPFFQRLERYAGSELSVCAIKPFHDYGADETCFMQRCEHGGKSTSPSPGIGKSASSREPPGDLSR